MTYQLRTQSVQVCGETLIVSQASNLMEIQRSVMISQADDRWKDRTVEGMDEQARRYLETFLYPSLCACTEGPVPTFEEFMTSVPAADIDDWLAVARERNPRWFPDLAKRAPEDEAQELEKKDELQTSSSPG